MKVRIEYTIEVDDDFRREINRWYGQPGLASRKDVKDWFRDYGESMNDDLSLNAMKREEHERGL